jgi:hypothetical protein
MQDRRTSLFPQAMSHQQRVDPCLMKMGTFEGRCRSLQLNPEYQTSNRSEMTMLHPNRPEDPVSYIRPHRSED